jgi:hypothetical protein
MLFVSIMGATCPFATAMLYAAVVGYRGGGGNTLLEFLSAICSDSQVSTYNMAFLGDLLLADTT